MEVDSLTALREKLKAELVQNAENELKSASQMALLELLVKENEFKLPPSLVDDEMRDMIARMGFTGKDVALENIDVEPFRQYFEESAVKRIRTAIIVDRIGAQEEIKVEEADTKAMIAKVAEEHNVTVEVATKALLDRSRVGGFLAEVRRTKIMDMLMARTNVKHVAPKKEKKK
jgi:trigger factor